MDSVPLCLAVYSDSTFAVDVFSTLCASPSFNGVLLTSVDTLIASSIDLRVVHLTGKQNTVADSLSHFHNDSVRSSVPGISILPFKPPRDTLGAAPL
ncbi:hypothetical protein OG21DRAFT_1518488 [Imleria badia]|nr:hypothetical protein OG21DRAFT_1518488 [Imleria badia]